MLVAHIGAASVPVSLLIFFSGEARVAASPAIKRELHFVVDWRETFSRVVEHFDDLLMRKQTVESREPEDRGTCTKTEIKKQHCPGERV